MLNILTHVLLPISDPLAGAVPTAHLYSYNSGLDTNSCKYYNGLIQDCKINRGNLYVICTNVLSVYY